MSTFDSSLWSGGVWDASLWASGAWDAPLVLNEDTFDTDTTSQYTQFAETPATWEISGGELVANGGQNSAFIRNGTSYTDVTTEVDMNWAFHGGLILRFVDNSNFYLLALSDDSGGNPSNLRIIKRVAGTFTTLASLDFVWAQGTPKTFRFQASGTTLTAFMDGVQQLQVTDSSLAGPGGVGMRNSINQSKYQAFRWGV